MKIIRISLILMLTASQTPAQNIDSLFTLYREATGERRIVLANEMSQAAFSLGIRDTLYIISNAMSADKIVAIAFELAGRNAFIVTQEMSKAADYFLQSAEKYILTGDTLFANPIMYNAGISYSFLGNNEKAIDIMLKCYEFEKRTNNLARLGTYLYGIGGLYRNWGKPEMSIKYFNEALEIGILLNDLERCAYNLSALASVYGDLGNYTEALKMVKQALDYDNQLTVAYKEQLIATDMYNMGEIYFKMDSIEQAKACLQHSVTYFEKEAKHYSLAHALLMLADVASNQKQYIEAERHLKRALQVVEPNDNHTQQRIFLLLYHVYKESQQTADALAYHEKYVALSDSLFKETTRQQISEFQVKYETAEKELEIANQNAVISRQNTQRQTLITGIVISVSILLLLWNMLRLRIRHNRALAKHNNTLTEANDALAEANATKDKFFSIISHDLKNPALAQRDALQLFADAAGEWDKASLSDYTQKLLKSADGQVILLNNLLNWAQVQTGSMPYIPVEFELIEAIRPDIAIVRNLADRKGIAFETLLPPAVTVAGDDKMLCTVIRNLLSNAVKFTPAGGKVVLEVSPTLPDEAKKESPSLTPPLREGVGGRLRISITGIGMTPEQIQNLYKIDRRHSSRGTSGEQGSGLGLIVCKELLEKHGITFSVESKAGKGSRFWFQV